MKLDDPPSPEEAAALRKYHDRINRRLERSWRFGVMIYAGDRAAAMLLIFYDMDRSGLSDAENRALAAIAREAFKGWDDARRAWVAWWSDNA